MTDIDPVKLVLQSLDLHQQDHASAEKKKLRTLRGGNSGVITEDGKLIGKCGRLSALRFNGINIEEHGLDKILMFQGGFSSEDFWLKHLKRTWDGDILCEEEIPIQWYTTSGITVSGRPDMVLCKDGKLEMGIELKKASSLWTARDVYLQNRPKMPHLVQAFHYMWQLKVPFKLIYTWYDKYPTPKWKTLGWPEPGEEGSEIIEYDDKGQPKNLVPGIRSFDLRLINGELYYRVTGTNSWIHTVLDIDGIERYYETVADMSVSRNQLTPRPLNVRPDGTKESWNLCKTCPMKEHCDKYENDPEEWWNKLPE